jgi:TRAP-type C4-dicarboxylate transport system permease large subunit
MAANYTVARRRGYGEVHPFEGWRSLGSATVDALPALMVPVLLLGGILSGVFTPTKRARSRRSTRHWSERSSIAASA